MKHNLTSTPNLTSLEKLSCVRVGFVYVLQFPPTVQTDMQVGLTEDPESPFGENVNMNGCLSPCD